MFSLMPFRRGRKAERELVPREPTPMDFFRREFASLFDGAFPAWPLSMETPWETWEPWGLDMEEKDKEVIVRAEVPGFEASELEVQITENLLTIKAEHKEPERKEEKEEKKPERHYGRLERTVTLPAGVETDKVEARYHNGILEIKMPKTPEALPRRVEVKT